MTDRLISCHDHMDLSQLPVDLWRWVCDGKRWGRWDCKPPATGSARPIKPL